MEIREQLKENIRRRARVDTMKSSRKLLSHAGAGKRYLEEEEEEKEE